MGWVDLLALGPTFMRYSGGASVPDSNPATFMVDGAYYSLSISLFDLFGDSPDVVPSKMRMAGRVTASPGATGTAYFGNGYLTDDYIVYAPLDANGEAQFSSGELDVGEAPYKYGSLVVGMESISPFQEVTFEITQFDAYFDVDDDDEEPAGECFWTDLVNATQECGEAPEPNDGFVDFWLNEHNGYGSAYGQVAIYHVEGGEQSQYVCNSALYEALLTAESVRITGLAVMQNPPTNDAPDGWDTCEVPLEDGIVWTDVDHEMSLRDTWGDGYNVMYYWYNNEPEGSHTWYNVRVDVDGQVFYGVVYIGGGV